MRIIMTIKVGKRSIELSEAEWKELKEKLDKLFPLKFDIAFPDFREREPKTDQLGNPICPQGETATSATYSDTKEQD